MTIVTTLCDAHLSPRITFHWLFELSKPIYISFFLLYFQMIFDFLDAPRNHLTALAIVCLLVSWRSFQWYIGRGSFKKRFFLPFLFFLLAYYSTFLPRETCDVVVSFLLRGEEGTRVPEWFYADNKNAQEDATTNEIPLMEEKCQEHKERKTKKLFFFVRVFACGSLTLTISGVFPITRHRRYIIPGLFYNTYTTFSCLFFFLRLWFFLK